MKRKTAYKYGFAMGRAEHNVSRMLFIMLCITLIFHCVGKFDIVFFLLIIDIAMWLNYWLNHKTEKYFHTMARRK